MGIFSRPNPYAGRVAVVTGGANGIGYGVAKELARRGCSVAICDFRSDKFSQRLSELKSLAPSSSSTSFSAHTVDVTDVASVASTRVDVLDAHGGAVDFVFNFAGRYGGTTLDEYSADLTELRGVMEVNFFGTVNVDRAFLKDIAASRGAIVNVASMFGLFSYPGCSCYAASKHAVAGFSRSIAVDCAIQHPGMSVHVVCPGIVATDVMIHSKEHFDTDQLDLTKRGLAKESYATPTVEQMSDSFKKLSSTTPEAAALQILNGVAAGTFRILVGNDAVALDLAHRAMPSWFYKPGFLVPYSTVVTVAVRFIGRKVLAACVVLALVRLFRRHRGF